MECQTIPIVLRPRSSFTISLEMMSSVYNTSSFKCPKDLKFLSLQEILQCKNLEEMLKFRNKLFDDISQKKSGCN
uniref:Uncharacterized protein n=1 Tax=Anguilla anguilla TaxID=7936 RepID=A0A0E9R2T5_ANGAN